MASSITRMGAEDCRIIETTIEGRIRRICYPKDCPKYGLSLIWEGVVEHRLSPAEAMDLEEGVRDVAAIDGTLDQLPPPPPPPGLLARLRKLVLGF